MKKKLLDLFKSNKKEGKKKHTLISSLAPKVLTKQKDIEKIQPYLDKLNETIDTRGINNIALTGGYGSGKSTIIETFKELNPQYKFLNISLASFNKKKSDDELSPSEKKIQKEELERLLEVSILQQIFYHVKPSKIPESRFKRIINIPNWKIWGISIGFILWISSTILLLKYDYLDKINPSTWDNKHSLDWFALSVFLIAFVGLGLFSKLIIRLFSNSKINKVNIKGELELGDNVNKSVFNEHLEEILYFFEKTKYDVVIIEDLDRFDSTDIFTKLREINILLNNAVPIGREINFVYAVGDDLFEDKKERVKFFEYIIPVIPFINSSNADEQLRTLIREAGLDEEIFTKEFISDVTTFIDDIDMRLLTNIFHEFVIYRKTLKPEFIKKNDELFAIITYKNIDPKDFNMLNRKNGKLYKLINNKKAYTNDLVQNLNGKIKLIKDQLPEIEKEAIVDIDELKSIYFKGILSKLPSNALINKTTIESDLDNILKEGSISYSYMNSSYGSLYHSSFTFKFSEIEKNIDPNHSYIDRVKFVNSKSKNQIDLLKTEIAELEKSKSEILNWDLKQVFNDIDVNQYLDDFSNNKLLRNLILNGYINENYNDYISLFHEVSITKEDFTFERNVKSGYATEFDYKLSEKIENLIERIDQRYFERETILNFDLLDYLGSNYNQYLNKYNSVINLLSNEKAKSIKFIDEYISNKDRPIEMFIEKLVGNWKGFWAFIINKSSYDYTRILEYLRLILSYAKIETILNNQNKSLLSEIVSENPRFLSLVENKNGLDYFGKISMFLKGLDIKFEKLDNPSDETKKLFDYVYNNNHYKINKDNLLQMLSVFGELDINNFNKSNYTTVLNSGCKTLIEYVNVEITPYVENVYLKLEDNCNDIEESLIGLLNHEDLSDHLKVKIIQQVETKVERIWSVNELDISEQLLLNNKLSPTWENVINYFEHVEKINEDLITFLNFENVFTELSKHSLKEDNEAFEKSMLICNDISDIAYEKLINSCCFIHDKLEFQNLNEEKITSLIGNGTLDTTKYNYDLLKEYFPNNHIALIEKNFIKFFDNSGDFEVDEDDILLILKSDNLNINNKFKYISSLEESTIVGNTDVSKAVGNIILQKSNIIEFAYDTIESIVKASNTKEGKVRFINLYSEHLTNDELIKATSLVGWNYDDMFKRQHKPTFEITSYNNTLFGILKSRNLIKSFDVHKKDETQIRVIANY